ncbi:hypothetical protein BLNAU_982 [Blattamonas nauphoetae]|uniref:Uncharacterized protein n=1 Tax=Blattamonas nauphoetae TaxID=2049346 RepID=A0ABQ9YJS3_9EUKA|nr:hypothetical protein BLNAU_982 [Blattamonas nauphoetae]
MYPHPNSLNQTRVFKDGTPFARTFSECIRQLSPLLRPDTDLYSCLANNSFSIEITEATLTGDRINFTFKGFRNPYESVQKTLSPMLSQYLDSSAAPNQTDTPRIIVDYYYPINISILVKPDLLDSVKSRLGPSTSHLAQCRFRTSASFENGFDPIANPLSECLLFELEKFDDPAIVSDTIPTFRSLFSKSPLIRQNTAKHLLWTYWNTTSLIISARIHSIDTTTFTSEYTLGNYPFPLDCCGSAEIELLTPYCKIDHYNMYFPEDQSDKMNEIYEMFTRMTTTHPYGGQNNQLNLRIRVCPLFIDDCSLILTFDSLITDLDPRYPKETHPRIRPRNQGGRARGPSPPRPGPQIYPGGGAQRGPTIHPVPVGQPGYVSQPGNFNQQYNQPPNPNSLPPNQLNYTNMNAPPGAFSNGPNINLGQPNQMAGHTPGPNMQQFVSPSSSTPSAMHVPQMTTLNPGQQSNLPHVTGVHQHQPYQHQMYNPQN